MTPFNVRQWLTRLGLLTGAALVLTACPEDAADITESASEPSQNFPISSNYVEPVGSFSVDNIAFTGFDPNFSPDAFARGGEPLGFNFSPDRYLLDPAARNSSNATRLPALGGAGTEVVGGLLADCRFGDDNFWGGPAPTSAWDFFCGVTGLLPNTDYSVLLVRYSLTVNGTLDTEEMLLTGAITQPDQLTLLGGTAGGYPNEECLFSLAPPAFTVGITPNTNPFNMGFVTTDGTGSLVFDCLIGTNGGLWEGTLTTPAGAPFAPNDGPTTFDLPHYNYVIVVEGQGTAMNPVPTGPTVMRFQVGNDIDASAAPINNGFAPLPVDSLTSAELDVLPGCNQCVSAVDSLSMLYNNLEALAGAAQYQLWLVDPDSAGASPIMGVGTYNKFQIVVVRDSVTGEIISQTDSLVETITGTSSFTGDASGEGFRHEMILGDASVMGNIGGFSWAVLTLSASPAATMPASRPLFYQYGTATTSGATSFGNFDAAAPSMSRIYIGGGQGNGGVREGILSADLTALSRPPIGYVLAGWVMGIPATFAPVQAETITSGNPDFIDLGNADVDLTAGVVTTNGILTANFRLDGNTADVDYTKFGFFQMTLEPKLGIAGLGPIPVQVGALPSVIISPPE